MPMQERLIASVLVPAQTQPQQKQSPEQEQAGIGGVLVGLLLLVVMAMAWGMRREKVLEDEAHQSEKSELAKAKQNEEIELAKKFQQEYSQASSAILKEASEDLKELLGSADKAAEERKRLRVQMAENWENANIEKIKEHKYALYKEYNDGILVDSYGNYDFEGWMQYDDIVGVPIYEIKNNIRDGRGFRRGFTYFWKNVLLEDGDMYGELWFEGWHKYRQEKLGNSTEEEWWQIISRWIFDHAIGPVAEELDAEEEERAEAGYSEDMSGEDYEIYCGRILQEAGWNVEQTQASNDQGVDLIAQIEDLKVCIQCKRYRNPVGNKAVQEVIAGKAFYNGTHAVVVSSAGFTKAAKNLAESADVLLISDTDLEDLETMV